LIVHPDFQVFVGIDDKAAVLDRSWPTRADALAEAGAGRALNGRRALPKQPTMRKTRSGEDANRNRKTIKQGRMWIFTGRDGPRQAVMREVCFL